MAAMSLTLAAISFHPKSAQGVVSRVKWTPSTTVSVVASSVDPGVSQAAVSSPMPRVRRKPQAPA